MAYVAISGDVLTRVEGKIAKMRNQEIASDCPNLEKVHTMDATELHNRANWGAEHLHLLNEIPKAWLRQRENATIRVKGTVDLEGVAIPTDLSKSVEFKGLTGAYGRPSTDYWGNSSADITIDDLRALPDDMVGRDECIATFEEAQTEAQIRHR